ncbi:UvrD-helicase domain-containing protein [Shewanella sp. M16]|uniref:UvrD-helicase domain-containing protein n=1 Tax=Shewanella sp. M16 TaxID=2830837 RepID=UPI001BAFFB73|nr:UvrD-helicase domain-containing protein [Shewanella sp. M16]MBS0042284.1 UvrD-helicase domain-containing protein [Shewanella sp. M16]
MPNILTLAVAGGRKTQGLVDHCNALSSNRKVALLTFTQTNQQEVKARLALQAGHASGIEVMGWYTFLLRHFAKPFLNMKFPGERVKGFDFDGRPSRYAKGKSRFMTADNKIFGCELGRLAFELMQATPALVHRLECIYDEILIDEVQDLASYDWEILEMLLHSKIEVHLVGDVRQSVLSTNPRGQKNKKFSYAASLEWFLKREAEKCLNIFYATTTYRCRQEIASFSDSIFDASWRFPETISENRNETGHDGVFLVRSEHVNEYMSQYSPQCLRNSKSSAKDLQLPFLNFKLVKGATFERVLVAPTKNIENFIKSGAPLESTAASTFYVAVTRAKQSVAIILDQPGQSTLQYWTP